MCYIIFMPRFLSKISIMINFRILFLWRALYTACDLLVQSQFSITITGIVETVGVLYSGSAVPYCIGLLGYPSLLVPVLGSNWLSSR